jgi:anthranilate phosphoribosyltransferase
VTLRETIARVLDGHRLDEDQAELVMKEIMAGGASPSQISAYLAALRLRGETVEEITGSARALRASAVRVPHSRPGVVDTCGTGGDGRGTLNVSTLAALVAAAAGAPVAKHGNRAVSSSCGSADLIEALGVSLELEPRGIARCIDEIGIGFLFAPRLHPAMRHAARPRRELGVRTLFNLLGPLVNPAGARRALLGVYRRDLVVPIARVLQRLGTERAIVVHGEDGTDEITVCGRTLAASLDGDRIETFEIAPDDLGLACANPGALRGGDVGENLRIAFEVLDGLPGARRDVVVANAAAALLVSGVARDLVEGRERAEEALDTGAARNLTDALARLTRSLADRAASG